MATRRSARLRSTPTLAEAVTRRSAFTRWLVTRAPEDLAQTRLSARKLSQTIRVEATTWVSDFLLWLITALEAATQPSAQVPELKSQTIIISTLARRLQVWL